MNEAPATGPYRQLVAVRIEPGFTRTVKRKFRGVLGCSQITELSPPMAAVTFQILWVPERSGRPWSPADHSRASPLGGCPAVRLDRKVVRLHFPDAHRPLYSADGDTT